MNARRILPPALFRRLLAAGGMALVLALTVFAVSPVAHARLHDHDHAHDTPDDDRCAIVLFADGVTPAVAPLDVVPPAAAVRDLTPMIGQEILLVAPRYLRQPERGPPARG